MFNDEIREINIVVAERKKTSTYMRKIFLYMLMQESGTVETGRVTVSRMHVGLFN